MAAPLSDSIAAYCSDTRNLEALPTSTETTFYPDIRTLLSAVLKSEKLPFDVRTGTSEKGKTSHDMPDFVLGDGALFVGVYGEVKRAGTSLEDLATSTEQKDQIGRYLAQTGVVLLCNVRGFGLLVCDPAHVRDGVTPVPPAKRVLQKTVDLWTAVTDGAKPKVDADAIAELVDIITRAVTDLARIGAPSDLAKILARQARDAKDALPDDLKPLKPLLDDYRQALGLAFDVDDEKGARFFRSSLVQSVFYALFAAWILWDKQAEADAAFDIDDAHSFLPIPFLDALLHDIRHPSRMKHLGLEPHLARAIATLNRVDRPLFRGRMTFPTIDGETSIAAITYFYEPFLEAFDPKLREDLGVWYTPPEIVRYQVRRVHHLLKSELDRPRGLADPEVIVLDPCCGTGAYLLEVARCIAEELIAEGDATTVGLELTTAFQERVIGFEILTAPFAIAQLQLYLLLEQLGAQPDPDRRLAVFLTNALSGWHDNGDVKLNFPEMREEFDASQQVKRDARIIVVLGNPPYDRFTGAAQAEEAELVAHYKGIDLVEQTTKDGTVKMDGFGHPLMKQRGSSRLYEEFGVRKQLLDVVIASVGRDLYERFFRGYTRKQWGMDPSELDRSVTARVPTRTNTDDRYFTDTFQQMPADGYTRMFERMLDHENIELRLGTSYAETIGEVDAGHVIYTGPIDEFFDFRFGKLPYRSLRFRHETLEQEWLQPVAVVNYPDEAVAHTRVTEYKHLTGQDHPCTSITYEYPADGGDPYYPIPRAENQALFKRYEALAAATPGVTFVGRLGTYKYYNMDQVVGQALATFRRIAAKTASAVPKAEGEMAAAAE